MLARTLIGATLLLGCGAHHDGASSDAASDAPDPLEAIAPVQTCGLTLPALTGCPSGLACMVDVPYLTVGSTTLTMDFVRPASGGPFPFVMLIHGGGFIGGSKDDRRLDALVLAQHGFAAATVDYRLMTTTPSVMDAFPAALQDVRCAVRYFRANASTYMIDAARFGVMGTSAGAVLTGQLGTESDVAGLDGTCPDAAQPVTIKAVVPFFGAFDVRPTAPAGSSTSLNSTAEAYLHRPPDDPAIDSAASSILHIDSGDATFLLVHGADDAAIPVEQSRLMLAALHDGAVRASLVVVPNTGHAFEPFQTSQPVMTASCTTLAFLQTYL